MRNKLSIVILLLLLTACGDTDRKPQRQLSAAEEACLSDVIELEIQHMQTSAEESLAAISAGALLEYAATERLREAQFDQLICEMTAACFEDQGTDERNMIVAKCIDRRIEARLDERL